jgi:hypothetical protein
MSSFFTQLFDNGKPQPESQTQLDIADLTAQRAKLDAMIDNLNASPPLNQSTRLGPLYVPGYAPNPVSSVGQPSWNGNALPPPPPSTGRRVRAPQDPAAAQVMRLSSDPAVAQVMSLSSDPQLGKFGSSFGDAYGSSGGKSYRRKARKAAKKSRKARKAAKKSKRSSRR